MGEKLSFKWIEVPKKKQPCFYLLFVLCSFNDRGSPEPGSLKVLPQREEEEKKVTGQNAGRGRENLRD